MSDLQETVQRRGRAEAGVPALFSPVEVAGLALRNRIVMSPMTRSFSEHGVPGEDVVAYYRRRAEGGTGLIITEGTYVAHPSAGDGSHIPRLDGPATVAAWRRVTEAVHGAGAPIFAQLWHMGLSPIPGTKVDRSVRLIGPSGLNGEGEAVAEPMTEAEIAALLEAYGVSAAAAKLAGFDGIEVHGGHGYLIDQFLWSRTNRRTDAYGGDLAGRTRFAAEAVRACRAAVGPRYPISFRFSQWKPADFAARLAETPDELAKMLEPIAEAGVDLFHCSQRRFWEPAFEGSPLSLSGWTRRLTDRPTITVGSVTIEPDGADARIAPGAQEQMERLALLLEREEFDLVAVGRAILANPDWARLVREGAYGELRPFIRADARQTLY